MRPLVGVFAALAVGDARLREGLLHAVLAVDQLRGGIRPDEYSLDRPRECDAAEKGSGVEVVFARFVHDSDA
jgi:hypothetical protein